MEKDKILEFAKKAGFLMVEYKGIWKDYKVYTPIRSKSCWDKEPHFILVKEKEIRFSKDYEELNDIIKNIKL